MTVVTMYQDKDRRYTGFKITGHSGYAEAGGDIVCSAISALVINTINSIEALAGDSFSYDEEEASGSMDFSLDNTLNNDTQLLLKSLVLGLSAIQKQYKSKYLKVKYEEV